MTPGPEHVIGVVALVVLAVLLAWRAIVWFLEIPRSPDPWDQETEKAIHEPEAVEVCHRCFDPVKPGSWFCQHCGCAVGPYNNLMPYVGIFSQGEVLRNGTNDKLPKSAFIIGGYLLVSFSLYFVFAPIYWIVFFKNLRQKKESAEQVKSPTD